MKILLVVVIAFTLIGCCTTRELSDARYLHKEINKVIKSTELSDAEKVWEIKRWMIIYEYRK